MMGYFVVILAGVIWATGGLIVRVLSNYGFQAMTIAFVRLLVAWLFSTLFVVVTRRPVFKVKRRDLLFFAILGFIGSAGSQPLYIWTVTLTTVSVAAILNYTSPVFVTILARVFLGERITPAKAVALGITVAGLVLVTGVYRVDSPVSALALAVGTASGFCYGSYTLLLKKTVADRTDPFVIQWWSMALGLPFMALYAWREMSAFSWSLPPAAYAAAILSGAGPGFAAFILFTLGIGRVQASRASIVATNRAGHCHNPRLPGSRGADGHCRGRGGRTGAHGNHAGRMGRPCRQ